MEALNLQVAVSCWLCCCCRRRRRERLYLVSRKVQLKKIGSKIVKRGQPTYYPCQRSHLQRFTTLFKGCYGNTISLWLPCLFSLFLSSSTVVFLSLFVLQFINFSFSIYGNTSIFLLVSFLYSFLPSFIYFFLSFSHSVFSISFKYFISPLPYTLFISVLLLSSYIFLSLYLTPIYSFLFIQGNTNVFLHWLFCLFTYSHFNILCLSHLVLQFISRHCHLFIFFSLSHPIIKSLSLFLFLLVWP